MLYVSGLVQGLSLILPEESSLSWHSPPQMLQCNRGYKYFPTHFSMIVEVSLCHRGWEMT